jgi:hypothetical protein
MSKLNWQRPRFAVAGRQTLDWRDNNDTAAKWLTALSHGKPQSLKTPRRPITQQERRLVTALRGRRLPERQSLFVQNMSGYDQITDKQGKYLRQMASWYGVMKSSCEVQRCPMPITANSSEVPPW